MRIRRHVPAVLCASATGYKSTSMPSCPHRPQAIKAPVGASGKGQGAGGQARAAAQPRGNAASPGSLHLATGSPAQTHTALLQPSLFAVSKAPLVLSSQERKRPAAQRALAQWVLSNARPLALRFGDPALRRTA
jgi:hypothetical protein